MIKPIALLILTIGIASCSTSRATPPEFELAEEVYGNWEYQKVLMQGAWVDVAEQNECGYRDVLEIRKTEHIKIKEKYIKGYVVGISMAKICTFDLFTYKPFITGNICTLTWAMPLNKRNRIVVMTDALIIEYQLTMPDSNLMVLSKIREIENYGFPQPDKIELKRIAEN